MAVAGYWHLKGKCSKYLAGGFSDISPQGLYVCVNSKSAEVTRDKLLKYCCQTLGHGPSGELMCQHSRGNIWAPTENLYVD